MGVAEEEPVSGAWRAGDVPTSSPFLIQCLNINEYASCFAVNWPQQAY